MLTIKDLKPSDSSKNMESIPTKLVEIIWRKSLDENKKWLYKCFIYFKSYWTGIQSLIVRPLSWNSIESMDFHDNLGYQNDRRNPNPHNKSLPNLLIDIIRTLHPSLLHPSKILSLLMHIFHKIFIIRLTPMSPSKVIFIMKIIGWICLRRVRIVIPLPFLLSFSILIPITMFKPTSIARSLTIHITIIPVSVTYIIFLIILFPLINILLTLAGSFNVLYASLISLNLSAKEIFLSGWYSFASL